MRLVAKWTLMLLVGVGAVLTVQALFHVSRVLELHERETWDDLETTGVALAAAVQELWQVAGEQRARAYVRHADSRRQRTRIRLVRAAGLAGPRTRTRDQQMVSTVPIPGHPGHALELSRTQTDRPAFIGEVIWTQVVTTVAMMLVFAAMSLVFGVRFVGRRVERLADQARRVATGDAALNEDTSRDELGFLAREMNQMVEQLEQAKQQIHEERRARTEAMEQLRHSDRLSTIGRIASSIAHELGTPLNVVSGRAMMIAEDLQAEAESRESAGVIVSQAQQMTTIIRQLLDYSRGRGVQRQLGDVGQVVDQALKLMEPLADDQGVRLSRSESPPVEAELDSEKVLQVLTNLIMNGIQAMPQGGEPSVAVAVERVEEPADIHATAGEYVRFDVRDSGVGIEPGHLEQIFEPFYTTKSSGQGTGLGLSVCHGIVREHGGWMAVESTPGKGSCFTVYLPSKGEP